MKILIIELTVIILLIIILIGLVLLIRGKVRSFLQEYFGTSSLKQAIENSKITDSETPKSLSSMENLYLDKIKTDFPDMNINELKSEAEKNIRDILHSIETKDEKYFKTKNEKIKSYIISKIEDLKDKKVNYDNIKFHKTVLNKYEIKDGIATIYFDSSLEYFYKLGSEIGRKVQTRYKTEFIYIIEANKVENKLRVLGINCPNCGAPVKTLGHKHCEYCGSGVVEIVKKTWNLNNIREKIFD